MFIKKELYLLSDSQRRTKYLKKHFNTQKVLKIVFDEYALRLVENQVQRKAVSSVSVFKYY